MTPCLLLRAPRGRTIGIAVTLAISIGATLSATALAQSYPSRPLRFVVPFVAGSATDSITRTVGQKLSDALAQPVVVDNRSGGAGALGSDVVAKAAPDGYTLLMATTSTHAILPVLQPQLAYDPLRDFTLIGLVARAPNIFIVSPTLPVGSVAELVAYARARPGQLNFASSGTGTITHLISELFVTAAGIKATHVPYKTGVQAMPDVISGRISFQFDSIVWSLPQVRAGKIKGLAITTAQRSALAPDMPTVAESGLPGFEAVTWLAAVAPAGVPREVAARLQSELARALAASDVRERLASQGAEASSSTPEELATLIRSDMAKWGKVIRDTGVKAE